MRWLGVEDEVGLNPEFGTAQKSVQSVFQTHETPCLKPICCQTYASCLFATSNRHAREMRRTQYACLLPDFTGYREFY